MFIKKIIKTDKKTKQRYEYYRLCESYQIKDKVRHRNLINLGDLKDLPDDKDRKALADSIERLINGQEVLFKGIIDEKVEELAEHYYNRQRKIYEALGYRDRPYRMKKFVLPETTLPHN